jgi:hypothetical protein
MHEMLFMGEGKPEAFRCRIYDGSERKPDPRADFVRLLAREGAIDCPAYDGWVAALQGRGWLAAAPELEPNPDGPGKIGRWRLTGIGRKEATAILGAL